MRFASNDELLQLRSDEIADGVSSVSVHFIASANGFLFKDLDGKEYIDFAGGIVEIRGLSAKLSIEVVKGSSRESAADKTAQLVSFCDHPG